MTLMTLAVTVREPGKQPVRSKILVDMDKFVYAEKMPNGDIYVWFAGSSSFLLDPKDFQDLLVQLGLDKNSMPGSLPGRQ